MRKIYQEGAQTVCSSPTNDFVLRVKKKICTYVSASLAVNPSQHTAKSMSRPPSHDRFLELYQEELRDASTAAVRSAASSVSMGRGSRSSSSLLPGGATQESRAQSIRSSLLPTFAGLRRSRSERIQDDPSPRVRGLSSPRSTSRCPTSPAPRRPEDDAALRPTRALPPSEAAALSLLQRQGSKFRVVDGQLRYANSSKSPSVCKWEFVSYDADWSARGLPGRYTNQLPFGIDYICGQPEYNTTQTAEGARRQHFQGFVVAKEAVTRAELAAILEIQLWAYPVGNDMVHKRIDYTKKEESAVRDDEGRSLWKEAGKVPENQKRAGDRYKDVVDIIKEGGTEIDVLEHNPQLGLSLLSNVSKTINLYQKPVDRPSLQVYVIVGRTRVGKSHFIRRILKDGDNTPVFNKPHPASPNNTDFWPNNYGGSTRVLLDDFHPKKYAITDMLNYLQEYAMSVQTKGGWVAARWNRIYITTNVPVDEWYSHLGPEFAENIAALKARIPLENRMVMKVRPPPNMTSTTWEEMKRYQDAQVMPVLAGNNDSNQNILLNALQGEKREDLLGVLRQLLG